MDSERHYNGGIGMSGRAVVVLSRFPAHLDATRPGKQLRVVADAVSTSLDDLSASLAFIRRAHRLGHADATTDIQLHAALHRIGADEFATIEARILRVQQATKVLQDAIAASNVVARDAAVIELRTLLSVGGTTVDPVAGAKALVAAARTLTDFEGRREAYRARVRSMSFIHARGNGTVAALLEAAASALDLEFDAGRARAFKQELRPVVTVAHTGTAGTTPYSYVVIARSLSKNVDRQSAVVTTATGNAVLDATNSNVLSWALPLDARDFVVFRVTNGASAASVGLLTPVALARTTTSFVDTGIVATAGTLDAEADDGLFHSQDRFWHAAFVRERAPAGVPTGGEIIGMEENPVRREITPKPPDPPDPTKPIGAPRKNAELFRVYRRGFGRSLLQIRIWGTGKRTVGPMLVNRDEGRGVGFVGAVPDGALLVFDEAGHVTLDGSDVTSNAFAWTGACFASNDDDPAAPHDFVFDGAGVSAERRAVFAKATPFDALDGAFAFPHAGDPIPVAGVGIGTTRFAFFVREAHFSQLDDTVSPSVTVPVSPRTHVGFLDSAVFAPPPDAAQQPAANIALSWLEHEAFALRVLLPRRFASFDNAGHPAMTELVRRALERHRPAGVEVRVEYVDDRWILSSSEVTAGSSADPILSLRGGSVLWTPPALTP